MNALHGLIILLLLTSNLVVAQRGSSKGKVNVLVRQSFESADEKSEPAAFLITFPQQASASYAVDGGVALEYETSRTSTKLVAEYHRNTLIEKEQNNSQIGYSGSFYLDDLKKPTNYMLTSTAKYVRDAVASKGSFLQTSEMAIFSPAFNKPVRPTKKITDSTGSITKENSISYFLFSPSLGYEYQYTFDATQQDRDSLLGTVVRGLVKCKASYTFNKRFESGIVMPVVQLYANGALRYDVVHSTKTPDGWHPYLQTGVDYIITRTTALDPRFSIGLSFTAGENPAQGLTRQEYWLLAMRFTL